MPCILVWSPVPLGQKQPQIITDPPLRFTVGAIQAGIISSDLGCTYICYMS